MPKLKMKTKSAVKKRFKLTANGRIKRKHAFLRHILTNKKPGNKRKLRHGAYIAKSQEHQIKAMIPYGLP
jgi:large subunit ribosomal protein L35